MNTTINQNTMTAFREIPDLYSNLSQAAEQRPASDGTQTGENVFSKLFAQAVASGKKTAETQSLSDSPPNESGKTEEESVDAQTPSADESDTAIGDTTLLAAMAVPTQEVLSETTIPGNPAIPTALTVLTPETAAPATIQTALSADGDGAGIATGLRSAPVMSEPILTDETQITTHQPPGFQALMPETEGTSERNGSPGSSVLSGFQSITDGKNAETPMTEAEQSGLETTTKQKTADVTSELTPRQSEPVGESESMATAGEITADKVMIQEADISESTVDPMKTANTAVAENAVITESEIRDLKPRKAEGIISAESPKEASTGNAEQQITPLTTGVTDEGLRTQSLTERSETIRQPETTAFAETAESAETVEAETEKSTVGLAAPVTAVADEETSETGAMAGVSEITPKSGENVQTANTQTVSQTDTKVPEEPLPVHSQISQEILTRLEQKNTSRFQMSLEPADLGQIEISMQMSAGKLIIDIAAANFKTQALLANQVDNLVMSMGLQNAKVEVVQSGNNAGTGQETLTNQTQAYAAGGDRAFSGDSQSGFLQKNNSGNLNQWVAAAIRNSETLTESPAITESGTLRTGRLDYII